jgi:hypothetical protein
MNFFFNRLPIELRDRVFDFSGMTQYWKHRFSMDVLTEINRGWRWTGVDHEGQYCDLCFTFGSGVYCGHRRWEYVSYDQVIEQRSNPQINTNPYLPWEVFNQFYNEMMGREILPFLAERDALMKRMLDRFENKEVDSDYESDNEGCFQVYPEDHEQVATSIDWGRFNSDIGIEYLIE